MLYYKIIIYYYGKIGSFGLLVINLNLKLIKYLSKSKKYIFLVLYIYHDKYVNK